MQVFKILHPCHPSSLVFPVIVSYPAHPALMMGNDIRKAAPEVLEILLNKEAIAVNQDPLGRQGVKVRDEGDLEVWIKVLGDGSRAVVMFNRGSKKAKMNVVWQEIGYPSHIKAAVRDIWQKKDMGSFRIGYSSDVAPHGVVMIKIKPE